MGLRAFCLLFVFVFWDRAFLCHPAWQFMALLPQPSMFWMTDSGSVTQCEVATNFIFICFKYGSHHWFNNHSVPTFGLCPRSSWDPLYEHRHVTFRFPLSFPGLLEELLWRRWWSAVERIGGSRGLTCRWLKMSAWQTACLLKTSAGNLYLTVTPVIFVGNAPEQGQRCAGVSNCLGGWRRGWGRGRGM